MDVTDHTLFDEATDREYDVIAYGTQGRPVIALPDWDFTCTSWENSGLVDALSDLIVDGRIRLFTADTLDMSGWYGRSVAAEYRRDNIEANLAFIERTLLPFVRTASASDDAPLLVGTGIGALNASLLMLRHPDWYAGLLALSGTYDVRQLVDVIDEGWEFLSPVDVAASLPPRGKVVRVLRGLPLAFVCGQGEDEAGLESQRALDAACAEKKLGATFEYWGYDVQPDVAWWCEEVRQLLPCLLEADGLELRRLARRASVAQAEADHASEVLEASQANLDDLRGQLDAASADLAAAEERLESESAVVAERAAAAEALAAEARDAWAERERVAQLLAEAQAVGDAAQAKADEASGELSVAEWIRGEAEAAAHAARDTMSALSDRVADAEGELSRVAALAKQAQDELSKVNDTIAKERAAEKSKRRTRAAAQAKVTVAKSSPKKTAAPVATAPKASGKAKAATTKSARSARASKPKGGASK